MGQEKLINLIDTFNYDTFPHSVLLLGERGSGEEEIFNYVSDKLSLTKYNITEMITTEYINQIYLSSNPALYTVDLMKITEKEQNILLKLFEEPNPYTYIILYSYSTYNIIETIITRSYTMKMSKYTWGELLPLVSDKSNTELILSTCFTPGQVEIANHTDTTKLYNLCTNIINKINKANIANTLSITNKINFKDEYDKFDLKLFINMLTHVILHENKPTLYHYINELDKNIWYMNDKPSYFDNFLIKVWEAARV